MRAFVFMTEQVSESLLPGRLPMALLPLVDRPLVQQQVEQLVEQGVTEVTLLACSGVERLRALLGDGARWGCRLTVQALSPEQPLASFCTLPPTDDLVVVALAERLFPAMPFPSTAQLRLDPSGRWAGWCLAPARLLSALSSRLPPGCIGDSLRGALPELTTSALAATNLFELVELQGAELARRQGTEVHIARSTRVHPRALLTGPVWIGPQCRIGAGVQLGPNVSLGAGCVIERGTRLRDALIAPGSYIGAELELDQVYVDRNRLINLRQEVGITIEDKFLLGSAAPTPNRLFPSFR
jgi:carbonic anhydrase/acetyltransferase-like protein (isoleucine patch superfamily)